MADNDPNSFLLLKIEAAKTLRVALICACIIGVAALVAMVVGVIYG